MLRSLMTAVTGVRAHQTMLDVTGNNIANANTTGFKKDFTLFSDLMYQTQKNATGPGDGRGGINPAQVGLGVQVAAIETIHTQGAANFTGNPSDMMIQGSGFFVYDNGSGGNLYSRAGAMARDANNDLVQSGTGYKLQGYAMERDPLDQSRFVQASDLSNVNIPLGKKLAPHATSVVKYQCNLDSRSGTYLPYGYPDLPYNAVCGWPGNPEGTARIKLGKDEDTYDMSFQTPGVSLGGSAAKYLTVTIDKGGSKALLDLNMVGISGGKPTLGLAGGSQAPNGTWTQTVTLPNTVPSDDVTVEYNDSTGILKIKNSEGKTQLQYNMKSAMNYASFSLTGSAASGRMTVPVIAEFDESADKAGSDLSKEKATLTMWYAVPDDTDPTKPPTMGKMTAVVHFNPDGTFDYIEEVVDVTGALPASIPPDKIQIIPNTAATSLLIQQDISAPSATSPSWNTVGQINQGGFHQTKQTIYDCNGNQYTLEVNFKKITENRWRWEAFLLDKDGKQISSDPTCEDGTSSTGGISDLIPQPNVGEISFCGCGPICDPLETEIEIPFSLKGMPNQTVKLNFGGDGDKLYGVTQYASETTTKAVYQDGYGMGILQDSSVGSDGTITGIYSNGQNIPLYRVALATFANQQGLEKVGDTMFRETVNSGIANIDAAGVNGKGTILGQNLEMSNVDLTEEFTHLIIAQRGFQANTRVITTSDQILEEVVNLKR